MPKFAQSGRLRLTPREIEYNIGPEFRASSCPDRAVMLAVIEKLLQWSERT